MNNTITMWITDKTGKEFFKTICGRGYHEGELRNLQGHLINARNQPAHYKFLDIDTAVIKIDGLTYSQIDLEDEELLRKLGA